MTTELFCRVEDEMLNVGKAGQAHLYPSEIVTIGLLFALKGVGNRAFYRWLKRDYEGLFPGLPERTRLFRLFNEHTPWTQTGMAAPSLIGLIDTYGIDLIHPRRAGRSEHQIGPKGKSNWRWIAGCKLCLLVNHPGLVVSWVSATATVYAGTPPAFQALVDALAADMLVVSDVGFDKNDWHPTHLKVCKRGAWNNRMLIETAFSRLTPIARFKKVGHRAWAYFESRLAYTVALFNLLVQWDGLTPDENGWGPLSIARFSL